MYNISWKWYISPRAEQELSVEGVPGKQPHPAHSQCRSTLGRGFTTSRKIHFLVTGHIVQNKIHSSREPAIISECGRQPKASLDGSSQQMYQKKIKIKSSQGQYNLWYTGKRVTHISEKNQKHSSRNNEITAKELNEIPTHFIHSLNRSGNYNLPNTRLRSGEKKLLHP